MRATSCALHFTPMRKLPAFSLLSSLMTTKPQIFFKWNGIYYETEKKVIGRRMIAEFKRLSVELYSAGMKTFFTDRVWGDHETFYAHALCFYVVTILKRTYSKYGIGLGVFTMEGFEAINVSTKRLLCNHSNHHGNVCVQAMVRMTHQFINHNHDVK